MLLQPDDDTMFKATALLTSVALLSGCALPTLDQNSVSALKGKTVVLVVPPMPRMAIVTPASVATVAFGAVGTALAAANKANMGGVAAFDMPDPALVVSAKLAERLTQRYGTSIVGTPIRQNIGGLSELAAVGGPLANYSLQVTTANMIMANYLTTPSRYRVQYLSVAVLIDNKTQQRVATGICSYEQQDPKLAATYEEMLANNGERAKRDVADGAEFCSQKLLREMFSV